MAFVLSFAYAELLIGHGWNLWNRECFRFFPVFLVSVCWLTWTRLGLDLQDQLQRSMWRVGPIAFAFALLTLVCAVGLRSPWFAAVSCLLLGDSLLSGFVKARSCWRLLAVLIPLPLGVDGRLVQKLQLISSEAAGRLLDFANVPHLMRGNVVQLADRRFFVDEACSGIGSVYLLLAAALYFVVSGRTRWLIALPLLLSVVWWATVANAARIFVIGAAHHRHSVDLASGWQHEAIGLLAIAVALTGIFATHCLLNFVFSPTGEAKTIEKNRVAPLTPAILWDLLTTPQSDERTSVVERGWFSVQVSQALLTKSLCVALLFSGGFYWISTAVAYSDGTENVDGLTASLPVAFETLNSDSLSSVGVPTVGFESTQREKLADRNLYGGYSKVWDVSNQSLQAKIAVDGPFDRWHDLRVCYEGQGWQIEETTVHAVPLLTAKKQLVFVRMVNVDGQHAHLHFCMFGADGRFVTPPFGKSAGSIVERIGERVRGALPRGGQSQVWQLQLFTQTGSVSVQSESEAERLIFGRIAACVLNHWRTQRAGAGTGDVGSN